MLVGFPIALAPCVSRPRRCDRQAHHRRRPAARSPKSLCLCLIAFLLPAGCRQIETRFDVTSFRNPGRPEQFTERFPTGAFAVDSQNNWEIAFDISDVRIELPQPSDAEPASSQSAEADVAFKPRTVSMSQYVHIRVFWKPKPGTTYVESTQTDASILYCLVTGGNAISYEGAGFVYFNQARDKKTITGRIESSTLVPVRTAKEPIDLFGPCRVEGWFVARQDRGRIVEIQQTLRRLLGRSGAAPVAAGQAAPVD